MTISSHLASSNVFSYGYRSCPSLSSIHSSEGNEHSFKPDSGPTNGPAVSSSAESHTLQLVTAIKPASPSLVTRPSGTSNCRTCQPRNYTDELKADLSSIFDNSWYQDGVSSIVGPKVSHRLATLRLAKLLIKPESKLIDGARILLPRNGVVTAPLPIIRRVSHVHVVRCPLRLLFNGMYDELPFGVL
jgi:hypothetical protein